MLSLTCVMEPRITNCQMIRHACVSGITCNSRTLERAVLSNHFIVITEFSFVTFKFAVNEVFSGEESY